MEFNKNALNKMFENYYKKTGNTATHVFVYSKYQNEISMNFEIDKKQPYVNNEPYSEMRSRDSDSGFKFKDTVLIAVGTYKDVSFNIN